MDFVLFFQYGEEFTYMFTTVNDLWVYLEVALGIGIAGFLIMYAFRAYTLYVVCVKEGYKHKWMSFVPFLNTYFIGEVSKKNKLFNANAKAFSIPTAALEVIMFVGYLVYYIVITVLLGQNNLVDTGEMGYEVSIYALNWMAWVYDNLGYILSWVSLVFFVMFMFTLMPFFMTYSARRYIIMSLFGAFFPISGALMFSVRNNTGMGYKEFMQREQERQYRQYQQNQQNGNPYNYNPYSGQPTPPPSGYGGNNNQTHTNAGASSNPFEDFDFGDPGSASTSGSYGTMDPFDHDEAVGGSGKSSYVQGDGESDVDPFSDDTDSAPEDTAPNEDEGKTYVNLPGNVPEEPETKDLKKSKTSDSEKAKAKSEKKAKAEAEKKAAEEKKKNPFEDF
ncbi:MAG: hypothetical protein LUD47_08020, partial [Clostridia bacterium]|nr:hypothetical protein [Clostridia bacterium]